MRGVGLLLACTLALALPATAQDQQALTDQYNSEIEPELKTATKSAPALMGAISSYTTWLKAVQVGGYDGDMLEVDYGKDLIGVAIDNAIKAASNDCVTNRDPGEAGNILVLYSLAQGFGITLDTDGELNERYNTCAHFRMTFHSVITTSVKKQQITSTVSGTVFLYHRAECLTHVGDSQAVRSLTQCGEPMRFAMAAPIDLRNDFDSVSLRRLAKRTRDATQSRRLLALAEVYDGGSRTDASRIGGVGLQIIRDWVLRFNARGPDGLVDGKSPGAPSKLNADHRRALAEVVEAGPVPAVDGVVRWRRKDLARWLLETFAISLDETTVGRELKALGFAKISARPRHYAQNELAVEAFKKNFPAELAKIRARLPKGVEIELWWQDEARIGQKNKLTRRWARRGTRPRAPRDQRTEWAYIFGAICPAKGKGAGLVMPWCDTDAMAAHLIEISAAVDPGAHAVLIVDQAGWHLTPKLAIPDNITVLALPPRSPELNPVENVWQFMRDNWLSNRIFKSYEDIVALCCQAWNNLIDQPWKIMSLGMRKWAHGF